MDPARLFALINEAIVAIATLLWPVVALIALLMFKKDIRQLFHRLRRGKFFGQEVELQPEVRELRVAADLAAEEVSPQVSSERDTALKASDSETPSLDLDVAGLMEGAQASPEVAVMRLSALLEKELRLLLGSLGYLAKGERFSAPKAVDRLSESGNLPRNTTQSLRIFWDLRNKIVHGHSTPDEREVLSVLDIGISLLRTVRAIPHEINIISHPDVPVYSDSSCVHERPGVVAVILETHSPDRTHVMRRIYPTTRRGYYLKGKRVTWEWSFTNTWGESWFRDPDTNKPQEAWSSSAEFVGRHTDEL